MFYKFQAKPTGCEIGPAGPIVVIPDEESGVPLVRLEPIKIPCGCGCDWCPTHTSSESITTYGPSDGVSDLDLGRHSKTVKAIVYFQILAR